MLKEVQRNPLFHKDQLPLFPSAITASTDATPSLTKKANFMASSASFSTTGVGSETNSSLEKTAVHSWSGRPRRMVLWTDRPAPSLTAALANAFFAGGIGLRAIWA